MKKFALWGGIVAITAWFGGLIVFDYAINHFPADYNTKTDAIVVLTGGRHRLAESFKLLNDGLADRLFISGGHLATEGVDFTHYLAFGDAADGRVA